MIRDFLIPTLLDRILQNRTTIPVVPDLKSNMVTRLEGGKVVDSLSGDLVRALGDWLRPVEAGVARISSAFVEDMISAGRLPVVSMADVTSTLAGSKRFKVDNTPRIFGDMTSRFLIVPGTNLRLREKITSSLIDGFYVEKYRPVNPVYTTNFVREMVDSAGARIVIFDEPATGATTPDRKAIARLITNDLRNQLPRTAWVVVIITNDDVLVDLIQQSTSVACAMFNPLDWGQPDPLASWVERMRLGPETDLQALCESEADDNRTFSIVSAAQAYQKFERRRV